MDEARDVLRRLRRIELLERGSTPPEVLLEELRALVAEAEAWARVEPGARARAERAIERCSEALEAPFVARI